MDTTLNNNIINNTVSRFAIVGVINTLVGTAIMLVCYNFFGMSYWWASAMNYSITSILSYFLNKSFTFRYGGNSRKSLLRFTFNIVLCYAIAYGIAKPLNIWLLSGLGKSMCENIALITGTILFIILNFLGQKYYAFNKKR